MKYGLIIFTVVLFLLGGLGPALGAAANTETADPPNAVFTQVKYQFDKVVDGTLVTHDFSIKNTGKGVLAISRVKTG